MEALNRLAWTLRQRGGRPLGIAAIALAALLLAELWLRPAWRSDAEAAQQQTLQLQREARDLSVQSRRTRVAEAPEGADRPAATAASRRMADLLALAVLHGVTVERLQRRDTDAAAQGGQRTTLVMPVRAAYADLRGFIEHALRADSALGLERMTLRRGKADVAEVEGEMRWALVHGPTPATAP
jgi:hypothetical protein